jgi:O-antigen ligase/polysaccharide polymerase Wzy-like membrane protein
VSDRPVPFPSRLHNGHVLGGAAFIALPGAVFSTPIVAPVLGIAAAVALVNRVVRERDWPKPPLALLVLLGGLFAYGALSTLWTVDVPLGLRLLAQLLGLFVAGPVLLDAAMRLRRDERDFFERAFVSGFLLGVVLLEFEIHSHAAIAEFFRSLDWVMRVIGPQRPILLTGYFNRATTLVGLLAAPAAAIVDRRLGWQAALILALAALVPVLSGHSETARLAFLLGALAFAAARLAPRHAATGLGILLALAILAAPLVLRSQVVGWTPAILTTPQKAPSLEHRIAIWDFVTGKIAERPLIGWGLNSSRVIPGGHENFAQNAEILPLHPHDMALQLWLELGAPGALLGALMVLYVTRAAGRLKDRPAAQAFALAAIMAAAVNGTAGYDLWHPWWISYLWLTGAFATAALAKGRPEAS